MIEMTKKFFESTAMEIFSIHMSGNFSEEFGTDDGITSIFAEEISEEKFTKEQESVKGNSLYDYPNWNEIGDEIEIVFDQRHGGSHDVYGFISASSFEEAENAAREWADENYKPF